jgi:dTDP-4-amino-4,6-dideoxygalactose transaminase
MTFNSDTAANYTYTQMLAWGTSGSVGANRNANQTNIRLSGRQIAPSATLPSLCEINIFNYTGSNFKPVFVDITLDGLNLDIDCVRAALENDPEIKIITFAHVLGNPPNMDDLMLLIKEYELILLEDCCESMGSQF